MTKRSLLVFVAGCAAFSLPTDASAQHYKYTRFDAGVVHAAPRPISNGSLYEYTRAIATVIDLVPNVAGVIGDGSTDNNIVLQNAFTAAAASGGNVRLPCGTFKITAELTATVANNTNFDFGGGGNDCTTLYVSGPVTAAIGVSYGGIYSSASIHDMTIITDQINKVEGLILSQSVSSSNPALSAQSRIENVNFLGGGGRGVTNGYFSRAIDVENVSNVSINNITCEGVSPAAWSGGQCVYLNGLPGRGTYGVVYNISNLRTYGVGDCVYINDYIQGVTANAINCTAGYRGVEINPSASGLMDQIEISNSQFGGNASYDVDLAASSAHLIHSSIYGNYFLEAARNGGGTYISGKYAVIANNHYLENVATTTPLITIAGESVIVEGNIMNGLNSGDTAIKGSASQAVIANNVATGFSTGISVPAGVDGELILGNLMNNTLDYGIDVQARNVPITDTRPRLIAALPGCTRAIDGSAFNVVNARSPSYGAALSDTANTAAIAVCDGSTATWRAH